jgi:hypothetical protein
MTFTKSLKRQVRQVVRYLPAFTGVVHRVGGRPGAARAAGRTVGEHTCAWKLGGYASLPLDEERPSPATLMIGTCRLCSRVRSRVLEGRWVPAEVGELIEIDDGFATVLVRIPDF